MKRLLLSPSSFVRSSQEFIKKHPETLEDLLSTLKILSEDAISPKLYTHKLKGKLKDSWACTFSYNFRIVFNIVRCEDSESILLESIGTYEEVY